MGVGGKDVVVGPHGAQGAHSRGLFPDVGVAKPADLAERVHLRGPFLEAPDQEHLRVEMEQLRSFHPGIVAETPTRRAGRGPRLRVCHPEQREGSRLMIETSPDSSLRSEWD